MIKIDLRLILICLLSVFLFFSYVSSFMQVLLIISILGTSCWLFAQKNLKIYKSSFFALVMGMLVLMMSFMAYDTGESLLFGIVIIGFAIVSDYVHKCSGEEQLNILKIVWYLSGLHVIATILQILFPSAIINFNSLILSSRTQIQVLMWMAEGAYSGITPQIGTNAFYICIFICISLCFFMSKHDRKYLVSCLVAFLALLATSKRAPLLIIVMIVGIFFERYFVNRINGKLGRLMDFLFKVFIIMLAIICFMLLVGLLNEGELDDISSGRITLYQLMIGYILQGGFLGNGFGYVMQSVGIHGHNIYLQLLCEYGFIAVFFFVFFIINFISIWRISIKKTSRLCGSISAYVQLFFLLYGLFGNPLYDYFQYGIYIVLSSISINLLDRGELL